MDEEKIILLINRFLAGEASVEEIHALNIIYNKIDSIYNKIDSQSSLVSSLTTQESQKLQRSMFDKISASIHQHDDKDQD